MLYPAAPPWLAARGGVSEPVARLSGDGWAVLGLPRAGALLAGSQGQVNQVAAVPSLALLAYPPAMALVLVWSGEHYVVDTVLGAVYAGVVVIAAAHARPVLARLRGLVAAPTVDA